MHTCVVIGFKYSHIEVNFTPKRISIYIKRNDMSTTILQHFYNKF